MNLHNYQRIIIIIIASGVFSWLGYALDFMPFTILSKVCFYGLFLGVVWVYFKYAIYRMTWVRHGDKVQAIIFGVLGAAFFGFVVYQLIKSELNF
jgi:hypothetical protein